MFFRLNTKNFLPKIVVPQTPSLLIATPDPTEKNIQGAPDLVVEILSPNTLERDKIIKKSLYEKHGVREYWIVDPTGKLIEVLTLKEEGFEVFGIFFLDDELTSPLLKKLRIPLKEIF